MPGESDQELEAAWVANDAPAVISALRKGANANATRNGAPLLMAACVVGREDVVRALLDAGASVNATNREGDSALMYVVATGVGEAQSRIRDMLLEHGADVKARDARGNTPLDLAVSYGRLENAEALLARGGTGSKRSLIDLERLRKARRTEGPGL